MRKLRLWLLAAVCAAPVVGWVYSEYLRPALAQPTCPGVNCLYNTNTNLPLDNGLRRTYSATFENFAPPTNPTDISQFCGNATTTVRLLEVRVSGLMSTAVNTPIALVRRQTPNTVMPASVILTPMVYDTNYGSVSSLPIVYPTTNPTTLGNAVGSIVSDIYFFGNTTTTSSMVPIVWRFGDRPASAVVLRGTNQCVSINLNGQGNTLTTTGAAIQIRWEWVEDGS